MNKHLLLPILLSGLLATSLSSCNSNNKPENSSDRVDTDSIANSPDTTLLPTDAIAANGRECYQWVKGRDTIKMTLKKDGEEMTGDLAYRFYEKDKSHGPIAGEMIGDTLLAEYTFDSEGMRSVREVIFLKKDGKWYEGYGDAEEKGGRMVFKNRSAIKFGEGSVLSKIDCP
jgi:hypothetical protein